MASVVATTALRKSGRLSTKVAVSYKEKKIPVKKCKITKKNVKKLIPAAVAAAVKVEKVKVEKVKVEKVQVEKIEVKKVKKVKLEKYYAISAENFDILRQNHLDAAIAHMKKHDPKLHAHLDEKAIADFKDRLGRADGTNPFMSLTRSIVYQQIHGKAAASIYGRVLDLFEDSRDEDDANWFPTPAQVLAKSVEDLRSAGLSGRKVEYIQNLATHFENKSITPELFDKMSDEEISTQLCAVKGIGQWTVDMFLMLDLHHPDVLPLGDLAVRKGVAKHFGLPLPTDKKKIFPLPNHMMELTEVWKPYRSLGSWLMWRIQNITITGDKLVKDDVGVLEED